MFWSFFYHCRESNQVLVWNCVNFGLRQGRSALNMLGLEGIMRELWFLWRNLQLWLVSPEVVYDLLISESIRLRWFRNLVLDQKQDEAEGEVKEKWSINRLLFSVSWTAIKSDGAKLALAANFYCTIRTIVVEKPLVLIIKIFQSPSRAWSSLWTHPHGGKHVVQDTLK